MVLHLVLGDEPLFHVGGYHLVHPAELGIYAVLGVVGGLGSVGFVKLLLHLRRRFARLPHPTRWFQPVAGGLTVGLLGFFVPQVMGVGYDHVEKALNGDLVLRTVLLLATLKIIATAVCYASGNAGGIFGPSLFIGAMMGASVGSVAHLLWPDSTAGPGAYALVGMGTAFAGIIRTPLTSVIMIFEVTRDYTIIVPLMISNLIAFFISQRLQRAPIYEALAHQDGIHLPTAGDRAQQSGVPVSTAMRRPPDPLSPNTSIGAARERIQLSELEAWPVANADGFCGMVRREQLAEAVARGWADREVSQLLGAEAGGGARAADVSDLPHLHPDHGFNAALALMGTTNSNVLPVVSRADMRRLLGVVTLDDILEAYGVSKPGDPEREK